jgi:hypothetical protein
MMGSVDTAAGLRRGYEVKASAFRTYIGEVEKLDLLPEVLAKVHPETLACAGASSVRRGEPRCG